MKKTVNKAIGRFVRLDKGYKTKLNQLIRKTGFGGISQISVETDLDRGTVSRVAKTGKCYKSTREKMQGYLDKKIPANEPTKQIA